MFSQFCFLGAQGSHPRRPYVPGAFLAHARLHAKGPIKVLKLDLVQD